MTSKSTRGDAGQSHIPPANDSAHINPPPLPWRPLRSASLEHSEARHQGVQNVLRQPSQDELDTHSPPLATASSHLQSTPSFISHSSSPIRKVQFSDDLEIFDVERLYFCDLRGNTRDLSETCSDPDWCSIGVARANKLVAFAEEFLLRKYLCTWWTATDFPQEFSQKGDNAQYNRGTSTDSTDDSATHEAHQVCQAVHEQPNGAANGAGRAAVQASRAPSNLSVRVPPDTVAMPYYLTSPLHSDTSPFLPNFPNILDMPTFPRCSSNDDDDEWSDWDSTSDCSSVRQSAEFVRS